VINRWMTAKARRDAARMGTVLYIIPSIDTIVQAFEPGHVFTDAAQRDLWMEPNINATGGLAGTLKVHVGQRVRLAQTVSKQCGLRETEATVVDIVLDPDEPFALDSDGTRERVLRYHPLAIYLRFVDAEDRANISALEGLAPELRRTGLFPLTSTLLAATRFTWVRRHTLPRETYLIRRVQFCILAAEVRTVTAQRRTFRGKAILDLRNARLPSETHWQHIYTMFSRATNLGDTILLNLPPKSKFEEGPPADLWDTVQRFEHESTVLTDYVRERLRELGWNMADFT
jgi:hypothetical protein